jgi:hypothetical protein
LISCLIDLFWFDERSSFKALFAPPLFVLSKQRAGGSHRVITFAGEAKVISRS